MMSLLLYIIAFGLVVHGLIHLMGLVAYWPLGTVAGLPYKTVLLNGRWEVGQAGMRLFSLLWMAATLGFLLSALGLVFGWTWWQPVLLVSVLLSLVVTVLDWQIAFRGAAIDVTLLAVFSPGGLASIAAQLLLEAGLIYLIVADWRRSHRRGIRQARAFGRARRRDPEARGRHNLG